MDPLPGVSSAPRIYSKRFPVPAEAIDLQGHVSNLAYVGWMQDVAIEHSAAVGWPMARYLSLGAGWVVRSHFIEYLRPAFLGEPLAVHTWVPRFDHRSTPRKYVFLQGKRPAGAGSGGDAVGVRGPDQRPAPPVAA